MYRFFEKNFFGLAKLIAFLVAIGSVVAIVMSGLMAFEKLQVTNNVRISTPIIDYQEYKNGALVIENKAEPGIFAKSIEEETDEIIKNLGTLSDEIINKDNMKTKVKVLLKLKTEKYPENIQLAYISSLNRLIKQLVADANDNTNVDEFLSWHDLQFAKSYDDQIDIQKNEQKRIDQIHTEGKELIILTIAGLGFFALFIMMLVLFRIEHNTRS
ncbi:hypothetical protein OAL99_01710 [Gammaproteobacteria bacterium]|jgi:hypothetical protein|nr:hypothetical protein [Gammaproteobacteria bacterium]